MSSSYIFGDNAFNARIDTFFSFGLDKKLDKALGFGPGDPQIQRIGEMAQQTAKEGEPRPIVWGRVRPISGNIMHASKPKSVFVESPGGGGKGGGAPTQYVELVYRSYAIRICEGPITGIIRVWRNNKLVYDARGNAWGAKNNAKFTKKATFYMGGWDQMPDPTLESIWGAGEVPAYRGTCYMVVKNENLTDMGGAVPQYIFEVERAEGTYLTSRPYPVETAESIGTEPAIAGVEIKLARVDGFAHESISVVPAVDGIEFVGPQEISEALAVVPAVDGIFIDGPQEISESISVTPAVDAVLYSISYQSPEPDAIAVTPAIEEIIIE